MRQIALESRAAQEQAAGQPKKVLAPITNGQGSQGGAEGMEDIAYAYEHKNDATEELERQQRQLEQ